MSAKIEEKPQPEQIDLGDNETFVFESLFEDLNTFIKRKNELAQMAQQLTVSIQQNDGELMGTGKAIQKLIEVTLKQKGIAGNYVWDKDKKALVINKNIPLAVR